jgi:hypothetical protein
MFSTLGRGLTPMMPKLQCMRIDVAMLDNATIHWLNVYWLSAQSIVYSTHKHNIESSSTMNITCKDHLQPVGSKYCYSNILLRYATHDTRIQCSRVLPARTTNVSSRVAWDVRPEMVLWPTVDDVHLAAWTKLH